MFSLLKRSVRKQRLSRWPRRCCMLSHTDRGLSWRKEKICSLKYNIYIYNGCVTLAYIRSSSRGFLMAITGVVRNSSSIIFYTVEYTVYKVYYIDVETRRLTGYPAESMLRDASTNYTYFPTLLNKRPRSAAVATLRLGSERLSGNLLS